MIDVGYAGVIGADRIADGDGLYGDGFSQDVPTGDTYGPVNYLLYVPFEQAHALERALGRPAGRPRRGDRLRPADDRRCCCCWDERCGRAGRERRSGSRSPTPGPRTPTRRSRSRRTPTTRSSRSPARCALLASRAARPSAPASRSALGAAAKFAPLAWRRCSRAARAAACSRLALARGRSALTVVPFIPDGGAARALRPDARLPGGARLAVQHLGPGDLAALAPDLVKAAASGWRCWWRSCRGGRATARSPPWGRRC